MKDIRPGVTLSGSRDNFPFLLTADSSAETETLKRRPTQSAGTLGVAK